MLSTSRSGYVFLIGVLSVGAILSAIIGTLMLMSIGEAKNSLTIIESNQAYANAATCAERALEALRADTYYAGNTTAVLPYGSCTIRTVGGYGNEDRLLCLEGDYGKSKRRIEISVLRLLPTTRLRSWKEVTSFTLCP